MKIGAVKMQLILAQYVAAQKLPLRVNRPEEFIRAFAHYKNFGSKRN